MKMLTMFRMCCEIMDILSFPYNFSSFPILSTMTCVAAFSGFFFLIRDNYIFYCQLDWP